MSTKPTPLKLQGISTPDPAYPSAAGKLEGEVLVSFTVLPNGGVTNARVVRGNPPRVFDASALMVVQNWKFAAPGREVNTERLLRFSPKA
jgi:periplasmic protein TonB